MSEPNLSFSEQLHLLFRATRQPGLFRFILIQYNTYPVLARVENALRNQYPERPLLRLRVAEENYASLLEKISAHQGLVLVEDFNRLLDDPGIYVGFNQRRDRLSRLPVQLLCFLPAGPEYMRDCMEKIRDWWSVRDLVLTFEIEGELTRQSGVVEQGQISSFGGYDTIGKREELERLLDRIALLGDRKEGSEILLSLYPQALEILTDLGEYKKGLELATHWMAAAETAGWGEPEKANIYDRLGTFHQHLGHYTDAAAYMEQALQIAEQKDDPSDIATFQSNLALVYKDLGRYGEAANLLEKALESTMENFGKDHPTVAVSQSNLALVYKDLGRYEEAADLLEKALKSDLENFGINHPTAARSQSNLATVYQNLGRYGEAADLLEKALKSDLENFGKDHPTVAVSQSNLANVYGDLGRYEKAAQLLKEALESDLKNFGQDHPNVAVRLNNLAWVYREQKQWEQALPLFEQAYGILLQSLGEGHPKTKSAKESIAYVREQMGE